jgi:hypothetical protein
VMTDLGSLGGFSSSEADRINSSGQIMGLAYDNTQHAFLATPVPTHQAVDFLHGAGPNPDPTTLFLDNSAPGAKAAKYKDSTSVKFAGGDPWKEVGTWTAAPALSTGFLTSQGSLHVWLGLKNGDDQGANFDVRVEVYKNDALLGSGESYCISGLTRNPNSAKDISVFVGPFSAGAFNGSTDALSLKVLTRVGTNGAGSLCGGHKNAEGLRLYFDAADRPSELDLTFGS